MNQGYKNIDDLFRNEFKDFELDPPEHVWENVKNSIPQAGRNNPFYRFRYGGIIGLSSVLILAGLLSFYYLTKNNNKTDYIPENNELRVENNEKSVVVPVDEKAAVIEFTNNGVKHKARRNTPVEVVHSSYVSMKVEKENNQDISEVAVATSGITAVEIPSTRDNSQTVSADKAQDMDDAKPDNLLAYAGNTAQAPVTSLPFENNSGEAVEGNLSKNESVNFDNMMKPTTPVSPGIKSDYGRKGNILLGLSFAPEITFFPSDNKFTNRSYSVDGSVIYKFSNYLLQSGIGVIFASDDGHYKVDYRKFLGTYEDVYDVTFDTTGGGMDPIYHTQTVEVYDSISRVALSPTKNRYTYLQIPVLFGYGEDYKRVSWFVKGGPSLAVLIHEGQPSVNFESGNDKVLNYENELPARINTNWSFVFSAGVGYKLGNHISITLEPTMRFYMKSAYERNVITTKHPYSFGVRTGLLFGF